MVDIHSHILYGIDDGASDIEEALLMIDREIEQGISIVVCTPHFNPLTQRLDVFVKRRENNFKILNQAVYNSGKKIELLLGAEVYYSSLLLDMSLQNLVIASTDYLLLEFSTSIPPSNLVGQMSELMVKGYKPIIAHFERYEYLWNNSKLINQLTGMGILMQVNASTILDKRKLSLIKACLKHSLIHVVASDAHNINERSPLLGEALNVLMSIDRNYTGLVVEASKRIIENEEVVVGSQAKRRNYL